MEPGIADRLQPRPPAPRLVRVLWRMQGPSRVIVARLERHPFGRELVIAFDGSDDPRHVIETWFERVDFRALQQRADDLRNLLAAKGWVEMRTGPA
jgi:hypothetical protein